LTDVAFQRCIMPACGATYGIREVRVDCAACGSLLDVVYDWDRLQPPKSFDFFEKKWSRRHDPLAASGVWRF
jgi:threonine synthase